MKNGNNDTSLHVAVDSYYNVTIAAATKHYRIKGKNSKTKIKHC